MQFLEKLLFYTKQLNINVKQIKRIEYVQEEYILFYHTFIEHPCYIIFFLVNANLLEIFL